MLGQKGTQQKLERMRCDAAAQLKREDVLRQLARLAFGRVDDAVTLALRRGETEPEGLELSAVSELRVTEKGVEVKLVDRDRVCALEVWCEALDGKQKDIRYSDTAEINSIIEASGGWEKSKSALRFGYCGAQRGFLKRRNI